MGGRNPGQLEMKLNIEESREEGGHTMKKLLIAIALCAFLAAPALADEPLYGTLLVQCITLNDGHTPAPCKIVAALRTCAGQNYVLPMYATGSQINLALLKAFNYGETVFAGMLLNLSPPDGSPFKIDIKKVTFGGCVTCP